VWQAFRDQIVEQGHDFELVTVGLDAAGAEACRSFVDAAFEIGRHPALVDTSHLVAELFGVVNIPNTIWIDEDGMIVRPIDVAPAPPSIELERESPFAGLTEVPDRMVEIMGEAGKIQRDPPAYEAALRDWITKGADSEFALSPADVVARSQPRDLDYATGQAHFELATHLETRGHHEAAIPHFREAHRLAPDNFAYRRQAWSLEPSVEGPLKRFVQGPMAGEEADWPYEGDWLSDVREMGAENYYPMWQA